MLSLQMQLVRMGPHWIWWIPNPTTGISLQEEKKGHRHQRRAMWRQSGDWSHESRDAGIASGQQKPGEGPGAESPQSIPWRAPRLW